jgi:hypothetical protein
MVQSVGDAILLLVAVERAPAGATKGKRYTGHGVALVSERGGVNDTLLRPAGRRIQQCGKFLAWFERDTSLCRNLNCLAGAWIASLSCFAISNLERSKATNFQLLTVLQCFGDGAQKRAHKSFCIRLAHFRGNRDLIDEMGFGHALQYRAMRLFAKPFLRGTVRRYPRPSQR